MKAVILAGGLGTRISEETHLRPKPMIEIGGKPILWHLMNIFALQGFNDFIISTGYKSEIIEKLVKRQEIIMEKLKEKKKEGKKIDPRAIIIMDDCLASK